MAGALPPRPGRWRPARLLQLLALVLAIGSMSADGAARQAGGGVTTSYGYAVFGTLKYGPDFKHFDYVNPDAPKGGSYRFAQPGTFDSLNQISLMGTAPTALTFLADTLMKQSQDEPASYYCLVCKSISWPANLGWAEFELREDARFADGHPMTADDLLYTFSIADGLVVPAFSRVPQMIERAERTGPNRVRFHFKMKHNPTLPTVVGQMPILPRHYFQDRDITKPTLDLPIGNGPYRVSGISPGRSLMLERVENYWAADHPVNKGRWNFATIRQDFYRDASLQNEAFAAGLSDMRVESSAANMRQLHRLPAFRSGAVKHDELDYDNGAVYNSLTLNARHPLLSDRRVRKALLLAYDYEWVKRVILGGDYGRVASYFDNSDFVASGLPNKGELAILNNYRASLPQEIFTQEPWLPQGGDRAKMRANLLAARDLLREAGYRVAQGRLVYPATGKPVTLELLAYSPLMIGQAAPFIQQLRKLGIEVNFRSVDSAQLRHLMRNYDYDLLLYRAFFAPVPTPGVGIALLWTSESADTPNLYNYSGVREPVIDEATARMIAATNRQAVVDGMRVIDRVARWQFYSIPLGHSYPTPVGRLPISYWDKFGRPGKEPSYNFPVTLADNWWYDPAKAARLKQGGRQ